MVVFMLSLVVFLLSKVPKVVLLVWFSVQYIDGSFTDGKFDNNDVAKWIIVRYENAMLRLLTVWSTFFSGNNVQRFIVFIFI